MGLWDKWQRHFLVFGTIDARTRGRAVVFITVFLNGSRAAASSTVCGPNSDRSVLRETKLTYFRKGVAP